MKTRAIFLGLFAGALLSVPAHAHRVGIPVTTIEWNERSETWEIIHRLSAHDVEDLLGKSAILGELDQSELNSQIGGYIQSKFQLLGIMSLNYVGAEIDRDTIWAYYELTGMDQTVVVRNQILQEAEATSVSLVNIETADRRSSLTFGSDSGWQGMQLTRPKGGN